LIISCKIFLSSSNVSNSALFALPHLTYFFKLWCYLNLSIHPLEVIKLLILNCYAKNLAFSHKISVLIISSVANALVIHNERAFSTWEK